MHICVDQGVIFFPFLAFIGMTSATVERTMQSAESGVKFMENTWNDEGEGEGGGEGVGAGRIGGPAGPGFYYLGLSLPVPASLT